MSDFILEFSPLNFELPDAFKWRKFIQWPYVMKTLNKFNSGPEKIDLWFAHFQMEFDLHIWWLSSPHEYFEMLEYEGDSSLASGRTGNRVFLHQCLRFSYVIYIGNPSKFACFEGFWELESHPRYLRDEIRYCLRSKSGSKHPPGCVRPAILKSKLDREVPVWWP